MPRQARWHEFLQNYNFELEHILGKSNTVADLLSRKKDLKEGVDINKDVIILSENLWSQARAIFTNETPEEFTPNYAIGPIYTSQGEEISADEFTPNDTAFTIQRIKEISADDFTEDKIKCLPSELRRLDPKFWSHHIYLGEDDIEEHCKVLQEIQDSPVGGHSRISNTWKIIKQHYEGPKLRQFVEQYVKGCAKCQESKVITHLKCTPLQPFNTQDHFNMCP